MARRVIDTFWDRKTRNDINDNFEELYEGMNGPISADRLPVIDGSMIAPGSITADNTDFITTGKNMFNGNYIKGYSYFSAIGEHGSVGVSSNENSYIEVIKIEIGETYTVTKYIGGNRLNVMLTKELPTASKHALLVAPIWQGDFSSGEQTYTFTNDVGAAYLIVQTNYGNANLPNLQVEKGTESTEYEDYEIKFAGEVDFKDVTPEKTTFFKKSDKNLFNGNYYTNLTYSLLPEGSNGRVIYTSSDDRYVAILEIENGETYSLTKLEGGNRFNVMLINDIPFSSNPVPLEAPIWQGTFTPDKQTYTFTNDVNAKYVAIQTNLGEPNPPRLQIEKGSTPTPYEPGIYIPKQYIEPNDEKDLSVDYRFNFPVNLYSLYRKQNDIANYIEDPGELTVEEYHTMFNDLVSQHTEIAKRTKLGDVTGDFPLYLYEIKPPTYWVDYENDSGGTGGRPSPLPKITMTTGIHGHERSPSISAFYAFKELLENPEDNELIEFIKMNVHFECIALANPSGWTDGTYNNGNNVNLNRDFPPNREPEQAEAILIKNHLDNANMDFFIDFHNMYFRDGYIGYTLSSSDVFKYSMNNVYRDLGRSWAKQYPEMPQEIDHIWGYNSIPNNGTVGNYVQTQLGIESALMEIIRSNNWLGGGSFSEPIARMGVELIVNAIASALRTK